MKCVSSSLLLISFRTTLFTVLQVETIGDAYMLVSGLPIRNGILHAGQIASTAWHLLDSVKHFVVAHKRDVQLKLRIGIHSGKFYRLTGSAGSAGQCRPLMIVP